MTLRRLCCGALLVVLAACGGEDPVPSDSGDAPSPYLYESENEEAALTLSQIRDGIETGLAVYAQLDAPVVHSIYASVREGDDECPAYSETYYDDNGRWYWNDTCESETGSTFTGWGVSLFYEDVVTTEDYRYDGYGYLSAAAKIRDPEGRVFEGAGYSYFYDRTALSSSNRTWYNRTYGHFRWEGSEGAGTWIDKGLIIDVIFSSTYYPAYPGRYVSMDGSVFGFDGDVDAIMVESLYLYDESMGSPCTAEPYGTISVRGESGSWYEVVFQGPEYWGAPAFPPECDGCGQASFRGKPMGEVCPSFSALMDWDPIDSTPWGY